MRRLPILLAALTLLSACAGQPPGDPSAPGFFWGVIHGGLMPLEFVVSIFDGDTRIYAYPNSGVWYDFGYLIGVFVWPGSGLWLTRRDRSDYP